MALEKGILGRLVGFRQFNGHSRPFWYFVFRMLWQSNVSAAKLGDIARDTSESFLVPLILL
jgi:hypothetical protein